MSGEELDGIQQLARIKVACGRIFQNQRDLESVKELERLIKNARPTIVKTLEAIIFSVFVPILKSISQDSSKFKEKEKQQIVDTFKAFFEKIKIDKLPLFFNIYGFLLFEIYDHQNHSVKTTSEEYKLSIVECMTTLASSLSSSVVEELYVKDNAPKLCQMIYVLLDVAKNEEFKTLRIAAINCIMAIAHVLHDDDFNDLVMCNQIADIFVFFLPGVATQLHRIALIDEKFGHKVPCVALQAWGRIVTLLMHNYNAADQKISSKVEFAPKTRWKDEKELKEYIKKTERSSQWYEETDKKLREIIIELTKLTHHSHPNVRLELVKMAATLIDNCVQTMPVSICRLTQIVVILSEDNEVVVSEKSKEILDQLSLKLTRSEFKSVLDGLGEAFYSEINSIPRKFNGIDENVQIVALNSLIGYINLLGKHNLTRVLLSREHLHKLALTLVHISEFDKSNISILEEYTTPEYDLHQHLKMSWKKFRFFNDPVIIQKIETVCLLVAKHGAFDVLADYFLDVILTDSEHRKEAIFLINEMLGGIEPHNFNIFKNVVETYTDGTHWYPPLSVMIDDDGYEHTLSDVQSNIIQVCLLVEGIGKLALTLGKDFQHFMLKTLYLVLERAGSGHTIIRTAGLLALSHVSTACGYSSITDLINANIDYFSFHIERKLNRTKEDTGGLAVLSVVIKYSTKEVLSSTCAVVNELLSRTYEEGRTNINSNLHVFKIFIAGLHQWLSFEPKSHSLKTKKQKLEDFEEFKVSNIEPINDFSDSIMGQTAEEMYKEDMEKNRAELEEDMDGPSEYKKPDPPQHIKLTTAILNRSLHYLPSKNQQRKLLVLEILKTGLPVLGDWENELLPIVHQIWSPLVDRFKESDAVVVNYSFQLLVVLATLSKEFIRSRTAKEVLPNILTLLNNMAKESYLKDKGSAYRYSQNYKLQVTILENLGLIITDLDMLEHDFEKSMEVVFKYLSDKQPLPLQKSALVFFKTMVTYDPQTTKNKVNLLATKAESEYDKNLNTIRGYLTE